MRFALVLDYRAIDDIQESIEYYDEQLEGLGETFFNYLSKSFKTLQKNPFYQVRYDDVHCLPLKKFPFMVHYSLDEKKNIIFIHAVINTKRDPKEYWVKRK